MSEKKENKLERLELPACDYSPILESMMSYYHFPTLIVANDLGLFSFLEDGPKSEEVIREHLNLGERACEAMLGILAALGFLLKRQGLFYLTEVSRNYLLPDKPFYWGGMFALFRDFPLNAMTLMEAMKKDTPKAFSNKYLGDEALIEDWKEGDCDPQQAQMFTAAMHSHSMPTALAVARWGNFKGVKRLLDVGGGSGCFCIALAMRYPEMRFTVTELEAICPVAEKYIAEFGFEDRIDTLAIDMFRDSWPAGYDAIFMSHIFHDWDLAHCYHLARNSFEVLPSGGRIYLHEILLNDTKDGPLPAISYSMQMIAFTKGKQLTADEMKTILTEVGFKNMSIIPTFGYHFLVSAEKP